MCNFGEIYLYAIKSLAKQIQDQENNFLIEFN